MHVVRGLHLLGVMARTNRGMRLLAVRVQRQGVGYVVGLTAIVLFVGTVGIYAFEHKLSAGVAAQSGNGTVGINDYGAALWTTAMVMTTIGLLSKDSGRSGALFLPGTVCNRSLWLCHRHAGNLLY